MLSDHCAGGLLCDIKGETGRDAHGQFPPIRSVARRIQSNHPE